MVTLNLIMRPMTQNQPIQPVDTNIVSNFAINDDSRNLHNIMQQFWLSEHIPEELNDDIAEFQRAEECFKSSVKLVHNQFHVDMPLKIPVSEIQLGDSFSIALQRFYALERKFNSDFVFFQKYKKFIDEYIELGHAKIVDISNYDVSKYPVYFLAHHAVMNKDSKTTKLRVVFDGSMKTKGGVSLNDVMLNGPIVQNELFDILILFRTYRYTLIGDIEKMFRQVRINNHQLSLQNILWRDNPTSPISCLQLQTVTYGLKASTFLSTRCLVELALKHKERFPLASKAIMQNMYIDDIIAGCDEVKQVQDLKNQLIQLLKLGSFSLHKWCSNSEDVLNDIPTHRRFFEEVEIKKDNVIKTLGLKYNLLTDTFTFTSPMASEQELLTKREILSFIGKMFDPLGLIGPIIVKAKLFMQELWSLKLDWDCKLPNKQIVYWQNFLHSLNDMGTVVAPRGITDSHTESVELVGYSDASFKAIGCCLYLRIFYKNGRVEVNLLCSKSRVAPLNKTLTIPKLELESALLLSRLVNRVHKTLQCRFSSKVVLYTDSQIVLAWLGSNCLKGNIYVSNRVQQIKKLTKNFDWSYVKSSENPADLLSRGVDPQKLQGNDLWWYGPQYLSIAEYQHKIVEYKNHISSDLDVKVTLPTNFCNIQTTEFELLNKYSDITKLQRIIAIIMRFRHNCTNPSKKVGSLSPKELHNSLLLIVRQLQLQYFPTEIESILAGKPIKTGLSKLHPFLDQNNLLRVGGRLQNATNISYDKMHPIILPKCCHIIHMIIQREHLWLLHAGLKLVLSSLSQRFYLVNGIQEVKKLLHKCIKCFHIKAVAAKQLMGSLPSQRVTQSRPFQITGVDFCGPFNMKIARIRKPLITKSYIALFVCFATKAIHMELVSDLTTAAFLACLQRFIARRGMPTQIFCDNAKTFKGASNYLKQLYELHTSRSHRDSIENYCSMNYIKFKFIPSYSPEFGGLWEAGVKSVKYHLKRVVGNMCLTFEELYTIIAQIEAILNSRPILPVSSDINDYTYLTPGHFLIGTSITTYPELDLSETNINRLKFWDTCTKLKQDFWKVWSKDYLTQLQSRPKWRYGSANLKEGDLVIVRADQVAPLNWPMGRIVKTFSGPDEKVRVAEVKIGNKIYTRSYRNLCPLPDDDN